LGYAEGVSFALAFASSAYRMTSEKDPKPPAGLVAGKYRMTRLLGRGGMGTVWEGVHEHLGTRVAVKFIDSEHVESDDVRQRFVNEARAAARLRSKHVVQVYDHGVGDDGRPYIVMEFLTGEPLDHRLDREVRLAPLEAAKIALHVCRALAKAHEGGIVHRDLKPENVFLVRDDEDHDDIAKVVDFGIAKFTDKQVSGASSSTRTGAVLGTPQFMSPEQARGLRTVDHRTDLWSLGVILYRALTGVLPFKGEAVGDLLVNICTGDVPVPSSIVSDVPPGFDAFIRRALAREPEHRFQSAAELSDAFAEVCGASLRFGPALSSRDAPPLVREPLTKAAVTASALSTTPVPAVRSKRPSSVALAALFFVVTGGAVIGARAVLHSGTEVAPSAEVPPRAPGARASASAVATEQASPAVTPVVSAPPMPSANEGAPAGSAFPAGKHRPRPAASETKPTGKPGHKPHPTDDLGY
jgi:serine/threonine-protein kinase